MKVFSVLLLIAFTNSSVNAQIKLIDSTTFNFNNPKVGDYITVRLLQSFCNRNMYHDPDDRKIIYEHIVPVILKFNKFIFQIESLTDCRASSEYNRLYSQRLADSLRAILISNGIDSNQILAKGMGEDSLLIKKCRCDLGDNRNICSEFEHQLNRRTILRIIGRKEE